MLVALGGAVTAVTWQAELYATDRAVDAAAPTTTADLPQECRGYARELVASNASIVEYHVGVGPATVVIRYAPGHGWESGDVVCLTRLRYPNNLVVDGESYNVRGSATKSTVHRQPAYGLVRLLGGLVGIGLLAVGLTRAE